MRFSLMISSAPRALSAENTAYPAVSRTSERARRTASSSSTTRMVRAGEGSVGISKHTHRRAAVATTETRWDGSTPGSRLEVGTHPGRQSAVLRRPLPHLFRSGGPQRARKSEVAQHLLLKEGLF